MSLGREDVGPQTASGLSAPPITFTAVLARNAAAAQSAAVLFKTAVEMQCSPPASPESMYPHMKDTP